MIRILRWLFFGVATLFLLLAVILASTTGSMDIYVHDTYAVVRPIELAGISILFAIVALTAGKSRKSPSR